jgi:hypothetical protein
MSTLLELEPINLQISENPYIIHQTGGNIAPNPKRILGRVNNKKYRFLVSNDSKYVFQYTNNNNRCMIEDMTKTSDDSNPFSLKISVPTQTDPVNSVSCEYIKNNPLKFTEKKIVSSYLGSGAFSAVLSILKEYDTTPKKRSYYGIDSVFDNEVIIKMFNNDNIDRFIENWKHDKSLYGDKIIDIYLFGSVVNEFGTEISKYIITRKYEVINKHTIKLLSLADKLTIIMDLLNFCALLETEEKVLSDVKYENIGYMSKNGQYVVVIIDYDEQTILNKAKLDALYYKYNKAFYLSVCKSYVPAYVDKLYSDYLWNDSEREELQGYVWKSGIVGIVDIINSLLLEGADSSIYGQLSVLIQKMNYSRFYKKKLFIDPLGYNMFVNLSIQKSIMVFGEDHEEIRPAVEDIVKKMLVFTYSEIPSYRSLYYDFHELLDVVLVNLDDGYDTMTGGHKKRYMKYAKKNNYLLSLLNKLA